MQNDYMQKTYLALIKLTYSSLSIRVKLLNLDLLDRPVRIVNIVDIHAEQINHVSHFV